MSEREDMGAPVPGQALAVPVEPASGLGDPEFRAAMNVIQDVRVLIVERCFK